MTLNHFKIYFVSRDSLSTDKKELFTKEMERYLKPDIEVGFERVN